MKNKLTEKAVETWIKAFENTEMGGLSQEGIDELLSILYTFRRMTDDLHWIIELSEGIEPKDVIIKKMVDTAKESLEFNTLDPISLHKTDE